MAPRKKNTAPAAPAEKKAPAPKKKTAELVAGTDIEKVRIEKQIPMPMSNEEFTRDAMELARVQGKISELDTRFAEVASKHRKDTRELRKDSVRLTSAINNRKVMKALSCFQVRDYRTNTLRYEDEHGKEVAPSEPMPPEMRQKTLFEDAPTERVDDEDESDEDDDGEE